MPTARTSSVIDVAGHDCVFPPGDVARARYLAASAAAAAVNAGVTATPPAPLMRECGVCALPVDLVAVAVERLMDQRWYP